MNQITIVFGIQIESVVRILPVGRLMAVAFNAFVLYLGSRIFQCFLTVDTYRLAGADIHDFAGIPAVRQTARQQYHLGMRVVRLLQRIRIDEIGDAHAIGLFRDLPGHALRREGPALFRFKDPDGVPGGPPAPRSGNVFRSPAVRAAGPLLCALNDQPGGGTGFGCLPMLGPACAVRRRRRGGMSASHLSHGRGPCGDRTVGRWRRNRMTGARPCKQRRLGGHRPVRRRRRGHPRPDGRRVGAALSRRRAEFRRRRGYSPVLRHAAVPLAGEVRLGASRRQDSRCRTFLKQSTSRFRCRHGPFDNTGGCGKYPRCISIAS